MRFFSSEFLFIFASAIALTPCSSVHRFLCGRIVQFLTNMHATHQTIYLTRHGQSEYNYQGKIGGDSGLSMMGEKFAGALAEYCVNTLTKGEFLFILIQATRLTSCFVQRPGDEGAEAVPTVDVIAATHDINRASYSAPEGQTERRRYQHDVLDGEEQGLDPDVTAGEFILILV